MAAAEQLRRDFTAEQLRDLAKGSRDAHQTRRRLALAEIYDGRSRTEAVRLGGVGLQTVRDWVLAFNADGPEGLVNGQAPGNPSLLDASQRGALMEIIEAGPNPAIHGVVRWRLIDVAQWIFEEFRLSISKQTLSREVSRRPTLPRCHGHSAKWTMVWSPGAMPPDGSSTLPPRS